MQGEKEGGEECVGEWYEYVGMCVVWILYNDGNDLFIFFFFMMINHSCDEMDLMGGTFLRNAMFIPILFLHEYG
jgi:hypothetical protein